MAATTKLELVQINARLANDNAELRAQLAGLQHDYAIVKAEFEQQAAHIALTLAQHRKVQATHVVPDWQAQRLTEMKEARAIAMATGRCTKV